MNPLDGCDLIKWKQSESRNNIFIKIDKVALYKNVLSVCPSSINEIVFCKDVYKFRVLSII
jgi:hypothetical protein